MRLLQSKSKLSTRTSLGRFEEQVRLKREQFMTPEEIEAERLRAEKEAPKVEAVKPEDLPLSLLQESSLRL